MANKDLPAQDGASAPFFHAWPQDAIEVGRVLDAWGIKGWVRIQAYSGHGDALFGAKHWYARSTGPKPGQRELKISSVREHGEGIVAKIEGVDDRNAAEALRGWELHLSRAEFPKAGEGEYYWVDLIGLKVLNREGQALGQVIGLIDTGPHCVFRIAPEGAVLPIKPDQERLIPFVAAFVDDVDLAAKVIKVDWGLDY